MTAERVVTELIGEQQLFAADFDNTMALTSEPAPNGMTVETAYRMAVGKVFGCYALEEYDVRGGLMNRAPMEIVGQLEPKLDFLARATKTEDLVTEKLSYLTSQIGSLLSDGSRWPRPTAGFEAFWMAVSDQPTVDTSSISSGHTAFIGKFFEVHALPQPDLMVTDDDMRPLIATLPSELCAKPARLLVDLLHYRWLEKQGLIRLYDERADVILASLERVTYAGDDPHKDYRLAQNAGVRFVHIEPRNTARGWEALSAQYRSHLNVAG